MLAIDADSHFVEPLDLFERRIEARFAIVPTRRKKTRPPASGGW